MKTTPEKPSANAPWHAADLDGYYVVRDCKNNVVFEHRNEGFSRDDKVRNCLLISAAPEMLLSLCEMILLLGEVAGKKGFKSSEWDIAGTLARATKITRKTAL